jgi:hypothetical protein
MKTYTKRVTMEPLINHQTGDIFEVVGTYRGRPWWIWLAFPDDR